MKITGIVSAVCLHSLTYLLSAFEGQVLKECVCVVYSVCVCVCVSEGLCKQEAVACAFLRLMWVICVSPGCCVPVCGTCLHINRVSSGVGMHVGKKYI